MVALTMAAVAASGVAIGRLDAASSHAAPIAPQGPQPFDHFPR
jgi:hypothetical protein